MGAIPAARLYHTIYMELAPRACGPFIIPTHTKYGGILFSGCLSVRNIFVPAQYLGKALMDFDQILHIYIDIDDI